MGITALCLVVLTGYLYWYATSFSSASGEPIKHFYSSIRAGMNAEPKQDSGRTNILILGLDTIVGQKDDSLLTDTMIVASIEYDSQTISLISLPRDLWIDAFRTKINAIYYYGEISDETSGKEFANKVVSQVTGLPIHHTVVINLNAIEQLINSLNGVTIDVPATFTDERFPRSDVDIQIATEDELYETVTFEKGIHTMDGQTALKYIRSRQSADLSEGTDIARGKRQQQLIKAILDKSLDTNTLKNPNILGSIYKIIRTQNDISDISDPEAVSVLTALGSGEIRVNPITFTISDADQAGVLINPPIAKYDQWVYEPLDPSWEEAHNYILEKLQ